MDWLISVLKRTNRLHPEDDKHNLSKRQESNQKVLLNLISNIFLRIKVKFRLRWLQSINLIRLIILIIFFESLWHIVEEK